MAQKNQEKAGAAGVPAVADPAEVRNVVLVGHSGAGKTTLVEALLAATGTITRAGSVGRGHHGHRPRPGCGPPAALGRAVPARRCSTTDVKINLLDTPGYADFVGELRAGLRAADAALFVVSAVDGMDAATAALWEECAAVGMPRAVAVTRLDHPRADFDEAVALCQRVFGDNVMPLYLPMLGDDGVSVAGLLGLVTRRVFDYTAGLPAAVREPDPEHLPAIDRVPRRAHRGDHRRERGRDPDGPLPRRRGDRHRGAHRRPGEGGRPGALLPGGPGLRRRPASGSTRCWRC